MAIITSTSKVDPAVSVYYDKTLLARARPFQIHTIAGQQKKVPANNSGVVKFRRYTNLSTATTPLTEGVTPEGQVMDKTDLTVTLDQYGDYVTITDKVQYIVEDQVLNEATDELGQQMGETIDEITRDVLAGTSSVDQCTDGPVKVTAPTELTFTDIQRVVKTLMGQSAKMFSPKIAGTTAVGTMPVSAAYWALAHTDILDDLDNLDEFQPVADYPKDSAVSTAEWGAVGNTRWLLSPLGYESSSVYSCFILGKDAYAVCVLNEGVSEHIYHPLGHGDDPLEQRTTMGWKTYFAARILNDNFMVNLKCMHT